MRHTLMMLLCLSSLGCPDATTHPEDLRPDAGPRQTVPDAGPSCSDGLKNGDETDVDCGGNTCGGCATWQRCSLRTDCQSGMTCQAYDMTGRGECGLLVASCIGNPCGAGAFCDHAADQMGDRYYCSRRIALDGKCSKHYDKDVNVCAPGLACTRVAAFDDRCRPEDGKVLREAGAVCLNSVECATGLHCDEVSKRCEPRAALGESCFDNDAECATGLECGFPAGLVCHSWVDCRMSQTACCATETGSECRPNTAPSACTPPAGSCKIDTYLDGSN